MTWDGPMFQIYYQKIPELVSTYLDKEEPGYLLRVDFDDYVDFLVDELAWEPLIWYREGATVEPFTARANRYDPVFERNFSIEEQRLRLRVPVSPHPQRLEYFKFGPSTTWAFQSEPAWQFEGDTLIHEVEASETAVKQGFDAIEFWIGNRNQDIESGNRSLKQRVRGVLEERKRTLEEKGEQLQAVLKSINIPLHQDPGALAKPIEIKPREMRTRLAKPTAKAAATEPTLSRDDVVSLVTFIEQYARQFEVTPTTYSKMGEEELRDLLVAMMNANYPGTSTAETFNKLGKTDISLRVDSGNVLICECKYWSGQKAYGEALDQLFRYLTWRQNYGVLIHFCKLKDMSRAVAEAKRSIEEHASYVPGTLHISSETRFATRHKHPQDSEKMIEVFHLFFDLSV